MIEPGRLIVGYTSRSHLMLDLDNTSLTKSKELALELMAEWPKIGDCMIFKSSSGTHRITVKPQCEPNKIIHYNRDNYMLIFDNIISYNLCCKIIEILAGLEIVQPAYFEIRKFRGDITMRVSSKSYSDRLIGPPVAIGYITNPYSLKRDNMINNYSHYLHTMIKLEADDVIRQSILYRFLRFFRCLSLLKPRLQNIFTLII